MVLTREAEIKIYQAFDALVHGGMKTGWIHEARPGVPPVEGHLFGRQNDEGWTELFVAISELTPAQEAHWKSINTIVGASPYKEEQNKFIILGFRANADRLQELSPQVAPDQQADTNTSGEEPVRVVRSRKRKAASGNEKPGGAFGGAH